MAIVKKKIHPEYFDLLIRGRKKYEFRLADFNIAEGDLLVLEEWDPRARKHTGRSIIKKVGYVNKFTLDDLQERFGISREEIDKNGFYIIQLE